MKLTPDQIEALLAAVLATYSYSLEDAWALRDALRAQRLCEPSFVAEQDVQGVGNLLKKAGYDRGGITYIIAPRVITLMEAIVRGRLDGLGGLVAAGNREGAEALLCTVKGLGPKSAALAWALLAG